MIPKVWPIGYQQGKQDSYAERHHPPPYCWRYSHRELEPWLKEANKVENLDYKFVQELDEKYYLNTYGIRLPVSFEYGEGCTLYDSEGNHTWIFSGALPWIPGL